MVSHWNISGNITKPLYMALNGLSRLLQEIKKKNLSKGFDVWKAKQESIMSFLCPYNPLVALVQHDESLLVSAVPPSWPHFFTSSPALGAGAKVKAFFDLRHDHPSKNESEFAWNVQATGLPMTQTHTYLPISQIGHEGVIVIGTTVLRQLGHSGWNDRNFYFNFLLSLLTYVY